MSNALRVIIFEDDFLLAEALSDALTKIGCNVIECCGGFAQAKLIVATADCDLAIVDLDLRGIDASPILDRLVERHIPAVVATAADNEDVPERLAHLPRLTKPYNTNQLKIVIDQMQSSGLLRLA